MHKAVSALLTLTVATCLSSAASARIDITHGWRFMRDLGAVGTARHFERPAFNDRAWATVVAGKSWTNQGYAEGRGYGWYRKWVEVPRSWRAHIVWLVLGGLNDCGTVYCNGRKISQFGDHRSVGVAESPIIANLTPAVRFGARNLIAVRAYDWASNGGLWRLPCMLTADPRDLPRAATLTLCPKYHAHSLLVDVDLRSCGVPAPWSAVSVTVRRDGAPNAIAALQLPVSARSQAASAEVPLRSVATNARYTVTAVLSSPGRGTPRAAHIVQRFSWPRIGWAKKYRNLKVLNNFVTVLLSAPVKTPKASWAIRNPRSGWVFFRLKNATQPPAAHVDGRTDPIVWHHNPRTGDLEAMLRLSEGRHTLHIEGAARSEIDVRTVPEIAYCYFPADPLIPAYGSYDWAFCEKHVFPHVNTLVTGGTVTPTQMASWVREGRQWIANAGLPGLNGPAPDATAVYEEWAQNPGFSQPSYAGMIVDEFVGGTGAHYRAWTEAVRRLHDDPAHAGRRFYAWCGDLFDDPAGTRFCKQMLRFGYPLAWERYLGEQSTRQDAEKLIFSDIVVPFRLYKRAVPGVERHMVMTLGYLSAPPESLNRDPSVDYHTFMDMQLRALATEPDFFGLYGVMEYSTRYADEETLRYTHELIRHYCIDGATAPLSTDPYELKHLANPDFAAGLAGWKVEPAQPGSVATGHMDGYSWLEGRYPKTDLGDQFCRMTRSAAGPNRISQRIGGLVPGRLYALKLISADMTDLHAHQKLAVSLQVEGAAVLRRYGFQQPYASIYDHQVPPYTRDLPAWMNYHRVVFRAIAPSATLTISDWASTTAPNGPIGHTTALNFVELQPFHAP